MRFDRPVLGDADLPAVLAGYDVGEPAGCEYLGGIPNVTYSVRTQRGRYAVRVCNNGYTSVPHLDCEVRALVHLHRHGFHLAPRPVPGLDGRLVQRWRGYRVLVTEFIDGTSADKLTIDAAVCAGVGAAVAGLNRALSGFEHRLPASESFRARSLRLFEQAGAGGWPLDWPAAVAQWQRAMAELEAAPGFVPVAIHSDIWPPNVICRGGHVVGIVDFDDLAVGPVQLELAAVLTEFACTAGPDLDEDLAAAVLRGFTAAGGALGPGEHRLLVAGIEASCASWLGANVLHGVPYEQSLALVRVLHRLAGEPGRRELAARLAALHHGGSDGDGSEIEHQRVVPG
jgi:homoserine kinase type II